MTDPTERTYWLSFTDAKRPTGDQFIGVCIVDVSQAEAEDTMLEIALRFPHVGKDAEWIAAATRKAHQMGCNPGGAVLAINITDSLPHAPCEVPRNRLMTFDELVAAGLQPERVSDS